MLPQLLVYVLLALTISVQSLVIRSGIAKLNDHNLRKSGNNFGATTQLGLANFESEHGFHSGNEDNFKKGQEGGEFVQREADNKEHLDEGKFEEGGYQNTDGGVVSDYGKKAEHKKGHHKSGFHNTYHKDESGSNSSYWDDSNDEGDGYTRDTTKKSFGENANKNTNGYYSDGAAHNKANVNNGHFSTGNNHENGQGNKRNYNNERIYDERKHDGVNKLGHGYDSSLNVNEETYKHYKPDYYNNQHQVGRITIYEDPRYVERYNDYNDYSRGQINYHYPDERYYRRPNYDYYY